MILVTAEESGRSPRAFEGFGRQWLFAGFPDTDGRLHAHHVLQIQFCDSRTESTVNSITGVGYHDSGRHTVLQCLPDLSQSDLWFGLKLNLFRDTCLFPPFPITGPNLRQIQSPGNRKAAGPCCYRQAHRYPAILLFANLSAVLSGNTRRMSTLLG